MILAVDVYYYETAAKSVGVLFEKWEDSEPYAIISAYIENPLAYEPGNFYKRELPCIRELLRKIDIKEIDTIIVDGYVFLDDNKKSGLGYHLYRSLPNEIPVIGVAKTSFKNNKSFVQELLRGSSKKPLYITSIGVELQEAAGYINKMHGDYRMPTLLKLVDTHTKIE